VHGLQALPAEAMDWPVSVTARLSVLAAISYFSDMLTSRYTIQRFTLQRFDRVAAREVVAADGSARCKVQLC
jgi:hypothetical protein